MALIHKVDDHGWHRIVQTADPKTKQPEVEGESASYQGIAQFTRIHPTHGLQRFIAVTGYHGPTYGNGLREGVIYLVTPVAHIEEEDA